MNKFLIIILVFINIFSNVMLINETHSLRSKIDVMSQEKEGMIHTIQDLEEILGEMRKKSKRK